MKTQVTVNIETINACLHLRFFDLKKLIDGRGEQYTRQDCLNKYYRLSDYLSGILVCLPLDDEYYLFIDDINIRLDEWADRITYENLNSVDARETFKYHIDFIFGQLDVFKKDFERGNVS